MIRGIVITHSTLCEGLIKSLTMIAGKVEGIHIIALNNGDGLFELVSIIKKHIEEYPKDEFILFVDMFGATPFNAASLVISELGYQVITGVNLPMLLTFALEKKYKQMNELIEDVVGAGKQSIQAITREQINDFGKEKGE